MPGGTSGPVLGAVGDAGQSETGIDPEVAQGLGLPALRTVADPGQAGQLRVLPEDQIGQRPPGQVGGGDPVAHVSPAHATPVARSIPTEENQSRRIPSGPPQPWVIRASASAGKSSTRVRRRATWTLGSRSNSGRMAEPRW